jgi:uncharacterized protein YecT (DUF1311 family)
MILTPLLALAAIAPDPEVDCANPRYQIEMNFCAQQDYERADAALNVQWKQTAAKMKEYDRAPYRPDDKRPGYMATLLTAQRAWLGYRDAHCESAGYVARGGSMEPMLVAGCMAELTEQRIAQLKALIEEN